MVRGAADGWDPYPFLDPANGGYADGRGDDRRDHRRVPRPVGHDDRARPVARRARSTDNARMNGGAIGTQIVDLSRPVEAGIVPSPGLPVPEIHAVLDHAASAGRYARAWTFQIDLITLYGNAGTYMDGPFHRCGGRRQISPRCRSAPVDLPAVPSTSGDAARPRIDAGKRPNRIEPGRPGRAATRLRSLLAAERLPPATTLPHPRCSGGCSSPPASRSWASIRSTSIRPSITERPPMRSCCARHPDRRAVTEARGDPGRRARGSRQPLERSGARTPSRSARSQSVPAHNSHRDRTAPAAPVPMAVDQAVGGSASVRRPPPTQVGSRHARCRACGAGCQSSSVSVAAWLIALALPGGRRRARIRAVSGRRRVALRELDRGRDQGQDAHDHLQTPGV